jgi:PEGA domain-containing protein
MSSPRKSSALLAGTLVTCIAGSSRVAGLDGVMEPPRIGSPSPDVFRGDTASLRLFVASRSAEVYVDGFYVGFVSDFGPDSDILPTSAGQHELIFHADGYRNLQRNVDLAPRSTVTLRASLTELEPGESSDLPPAPRPVQQASASCSSSVREQARRQLRGLSLGLDGCVGCP